MPASRRISEQSRADLSLKRELNPPNLSPHKKTNEISANLAIKENVTKQKPMQSLGGKYGTEVKRRIKCTPSASPGIYTFFFFFFFFLSKDLGRFHHE